MTAATAARCLHGLSVLSGATSAVVAFIDGFSAKPVAAYPWAVPIAVACLAVAVVAWFAGSAFVRD